jgi:hypothetical protein
MLKIQIPIVSQCVLNQFHGHWLLPNAIFVSISMIFGMCNINFVATDVMQAVCGPTIAWFLKIQIYIF